MKRINILSCFIIILLTFASYAEARSYSGGFRSQRTAPAPQRAAPHRAAPVATPTTPAKNTFGSFGGKPAGVVPSTSPQNATPLTMSKDLNANAAQTNALKTLDSRTATAAGAGVGATTAAGNSGWFRSGNPNTANTAPIQATQPTIQHNGGGGFINNAMWFMLGSSVGSTLAGNHHTDTHYYGENRPQYTGNAIVGGNGQAADPVTDMPAPIEEKESFFMRLLRLILWAAIFFGVYKLVSNILRFRKNRTSQPSNYTLGN